MTFGKEQQDLQRSVRKSGDQEGKRKILPSETPKDSLPCSLYTCRKKIQTPQESKSNKAKRHVISQGLDSVSFAGPSAMLQGTGNTC